MLAITHAFAWNIGAPADGDDVVHPIFMLRHDADKLREFEATFYAVSDPDNARYGQHLTKQQIAWQLPPVAGAQDTVLSFLKEHGIDEHVSVSKTGDMISAVVPVRIAEMMFSTTFHHYTHDLGFKVIRTANAPSIRADVAEKVYLVGDIEELPGLRSPLVTDSQHADAAEMRTDGWPRSCGFACRHSVTPALLQQAYNYGPSPGYQNTTMAVAEFQGVSWDQNDLTHFQKSCNLSTPVKVDKQIGKNSGLVCKVPLIGGELCAEALLDIEYIKAVAGDVPLTGVSDLKYSLLTWAKQMEDLDVTPAVASVSYGNDERQQSSQGYMDACNVQFMKLGAQGVSVLFAAGDQGVWGRSGVGKQFNPDFPASSPYITTVGGTDFLAKSVIGAEKAWSSGGSGFSNHFPIPEYQRMAVNGYIAAAKKAGVLPPAEFWNSTGRAYPDVSALGGMQNPYCVSISLFLFPSFMGIAGTSASCPVVAGLIARLNGERAAKGKSLMGFLNPFIYKNGQAFNDVQHGSTNGAGSKGFQALPGWDPATGFGSPNYAKLLAAAMEAVEGVVVV